MYSIRMVVAILLVASSAIAHGAGRAENRFGSIFIDGKKAGQIHYTIQYGDNGDVESLKTNASLSILGLKVYTFEQTLHEEWRQGQLHELRGRTDDAGKIYEASLQRGPSQYSGAVNGSRVELPDRAFPASVWHYAIVDHPLLFDLKLFKLMNVRTSRSQETLTIDKRSIPTERFDFAGDWTATAWFDAKHELVQFRHHIDNHEVIVRLDD
ncbi:MAG TPA: DUF6134 family protein [Casimicrobiaceae bacterium]|jgi:hypothetical protein